jgi:endonuclease YncB( thermonuclease family)
MIGIRYLLVVSTLLGGLAHAGTLLSVVVGVADGDTITMALLMQGMACHYKQYALEQPQAEREQYSFAEAESRSKRVGLWVDAEPMPPWKWRHR